MILKHYLLLAGAFLISVQAWPHDFKLAIYEVYESEGKHHLTIKFDTEDLQRSIGIEYDHLSEEWEQKVGEYIRKHFYLKFNGEYAVIRFSEVNTGSDLVVIKTTLHNVATPIQNIDVFSTCLNEVEGHTNLVQANFFGKKRYFRLSKDRIKTLIEY